MTPISQATNLDPGSHSVIQPLFAGLRDRDYAKEGLFVLEGRLVLEKALASGIQVVAALCVPADESDWIRKLPAGVPLMVVPRPEMEAVVGFAFHRGILALARRPPPPRRAAASDKPPRALALWQVTDPDNLGALIRSAAALGFTAIFLGPGCADPYGRKALRSGMGCALSLPLYPVADLSDVRKACPEARLIAAALTPEAVAPSDLASVRLAGDGTVLLLGNEGWGLPPELLAEVDCCVQIPMANQVDSLNVGAAGAILMWELSRLF